jgi:hypothetical protein
MMINSTAEALSIKIKQQQLAKSPQYVEYLKTTKWNGVLPQVTGSGGLIIDMSKK